MTRSEAIEILWDIATGSDTEDADKIAAVNALGEIEGWVPNYGQFTRRIGRPRSMPGARFFSLKLTSNELRRE